MKGCLPLPHPPLPPWGGGRRAEGPWDWLAPTGNLGRSGTVPEGSPPLPVLLWPARALHASEGTIHTHTSDPDSGWPRPGRCS